MVDVLVSFSVVIVLIAILLPSLRGVRNTAERVVCRSNVRQVGLGLGFFANENQDRLPSTYWLEAYGNQRDDTVHHAHETLKLYLWETPTNGVRAGWDGLGHLYEGEYLATPQIFYCPSHNGAHTYGEYASTWNSRRGSIFGNFQFRGVGPNGIRTLHGVDPRSSAIVADALRSQMDFNHEQGLNVLTADLAVYWFTDEDRSLKSSLLPDEAEVIARVNEATNATNSAWRILDERAQGR
ncbi:MAG: hypothetical protein KDA28_15545 [Phycisphaerales bacterium]|nr:hypothetical protein [Phycisphaerales bacterium]